MKYKATNAEYAILPSGNESQFPSVSWSSFCDIVFTLPPVVAAVQWLGESATDVKVVGSRLHLKATAKTKRRSPSICGNESKDLKIPIWFIWFTFRRFFLFKAVLKLKIICEASDFIVHKVRGCWVSCPHFEVSLFFFFLHSYHVLGFKALRCENSENDKLWYTDGEDSMAKLLAFYCLMFHR